MRERNRGRPTCCCIHSVAEQLSQAEPGGRSTEDFVQELCEIGTQSNRSEKFYGSRLPPTSVLEHFRDDTHAAAVLTNTHSLVQDLLKSEKIEKKQSWLFGWIGNIVASRGNKALIHAIMSTCDPKDIKETRRQLLHSAAHAGQLEAVELIWSLRTDDFAWEFQRRGKCHAAYNERKVANLNTPSIRVFEFLQEKRRLHCTARTYGESQYTNFLCEATCSGWTKMAAVYLDLGARIEGRVPIPGHTMHENDGRPLLSACKRGYEDLVDLFLERGASTDAPALEVAAQNGNLAIVRKLLRHGAEFGQALLRAAERGWGDVVEELLDSKAEIGDNIQSLVVAAIRHEHERMFGVLIRYNGGCLGGRVKAECVRFANEEGLESMALMVDDIRANS